MWLSAAAPSEGQLHHSTGSSRTWVVKKLGCQIHKVVKFHCVVKRARLGSSTQSHIPGTLQPK